MEILEIRSAHDLTTKVPDERAPGAHAYQVNVRQFISTQREWKRNPAPEGQLQPMMTLGFERIWISEKEIQEVADAIKSMRSPVELT